MTRIFVLGIGYKPLDKRSREIILQAGTILASQRLFDVFSLYGEFEAVKDRVRVINNIGETMDFIRASLNDDATSAITLLASGDPMFFGIGRRVLEDFGKDLCEMLPDMSSMQLAFARIKEPWDDALLMSLHGGPDLNRRRKLEYGLGDLPALAARHKRICILTDRVNNPAVIARALAACNAGLISSLRIYVCEKLGYPDERIFEGTPPEVSSMTFADPNVVIIKNEKACRDDVLPRPSREARTATDEVFGLTENDILHSRGLITKDEVRAVAIHRLCLPAAGVLWDIGAGSGSVSMEAARLCCGLRVYSIEKDEEQVANIMQNRERLGLSSVEVVRGEAPEALSALPDPDRVFIGGSGGRIGEIISHISGRISSGIVVINAATLETFTLAGEALRKTGFSVEASQISVSRMKPIGEGNFFSALNPVFVIQGKK